MIAAVAILAAVAAEALFVYAVAELFAAGYEPRHRDAVNCVTFVLIGLVAFAQVRISDWFALSRRAAVLVSIGLAFFVLYGALRIEFAGDLAVWNFAWVGDFLSDAEATAQEGGRAFIGSMFLGAVWLRSSYRGTQEIDLETIPRTLAIPFALLTLVVVFGASTSRTAEIARAGVVFYVIGLLALALSQLSLSGATFGNVRAGETAGILLGGVAAAVVVGVIALTVVFGVLRPVLGPVLNTVVIHVLTWLLTPPAWLMEKLFALIPIGEGPLIELADFRQQLGDAQEGPGGGDSGRKAVGRTVIRMGGLLVFVGLGALALALAVRLRRPGAGPHLGTESAASGGLGDDLARWLRSLTGRPQARKGWQNRTGVYALYHEVLTRAESRGLTRQQYTTAREFAPSLRSEFHLTVTDEITEAFEEARYGGREPDGAAVDSLRRRWLEPPQPNTESRMP